MTREFPSSRSHLHVSKSMALDTLGRTRVGCQNSWRKAAFQYTISYGIYVKATSHYFSDCSSDQGTFKKAKWQLDSKCPSSHSTLKRSFASRILTTTGATISNSLSCPRKNYTTNFQPSKKKKRPEITLLKMLSTQSVVGLSMESQTAIQPTRTRFRL